MTENGNQLGTGRFREGRAHVPRRNLATVLDAHLDQLVMFEFYRRFLRHGLRHSPLAHPDNGMECVSEAAEVALLLAGEGHRARVAHGHGARPGAVEGGMEPPGRSAARVARVQAVLARRVGSVVVVAESVRRRHNASAILRTCEAFGVHEVHLVTQGFRPSEGAARGSERWVRMRLFATTAESLADLKARGFRIWVADLLPGALTPETVPVDGPIALVFGSEVRGVSAEARALADGAVIIPMSGLTGSLNVSVSAAILIRAVAERVRALRGSDLPAEEQARFLDAWMTGEEAAEAGWRHRTQ